MTTKKHKIVNGLSDYRFSTCALLEESDCIGLATEQKVLVLSYMLPELKEKKKIVAQYLHFLFWKK